MGAAGAGASPGILALSKISNKYMANTLDSYYHMIQMAFCTWFIYWDTHLIRLLTFTNNQCHYIEHKKMLLIVGFGFNHVITF